MRFAVFELLQFKYFVDLPRLIFHWWGKFAFPGTPRVEWPESYQIWKGNLSSLYEHVTF